MYVVEDSFINLSKGVVYWYVYEYMVELNFLLECWWRCELAVCSLATFQTSCVRARRLIHEELLLQHSP